MRLAVEDAQRIAFEPRLAVLAKDLRMVTKVLVERVTPCRASFGIAERVELEDRAADPEFLQQLVGEGEQLDVGLRLGRADNLGVKLVEFAKAALLRAVVPKCG